MKTAATLILFMLLTTVVFAQVEKGNLYIQASSNIGFKTEKLTTVTAGTSEESSKSINFGFRPVAGYFVIDNLPVGLAVESDFYKSKNIDSDYEYKSADFTIGPFARYYFLAQEKLKPMAEVSFGFGSSKYTNTYSGTSNETKYGIVKYGVGAGVSYFVTDYIAFDLLIGYNSVKYKDKDPDPEDRSKASTSETSEKYAGIGIDLGIVVILPQ